MPMRQLEIKIKGWYAAERKKQLWAIERLDREAGSRVKRSSKIKATGRNRLLRNCFSEILF
jgi:hypothetical protein